MPRGSLLHHSQHRYAVIMTLYFSLPRRSRHVLPPYWAALSSSGSRTASTSVTATGSAMRLLHHSQRVTPPCCVALHSASALSTRSAAILSLSCTLSQRQSQRKHICDSSGFRYARRLRCSALLALCALLLGCTIAFRSILDTICRCAKLHFNQQESHRRHICDMLLSTLDELCRR